MSVGHLDHVMLTVYSLMEDVTWKLKGFHVWLSWQDPFA